MSNPFHENLANSATNRFNSYYSWIQHQSRQGLRMGAFVISSVILFNTIIIWSICLYLIIYWLVIPSLLVFESPLLFDYNLTFPTAQMYFSSFDQQWVREDLTLPGIHENPLLFGEYYDVHVDIVLPEKSVNLDLGVFMVETHLLGSKNPTKPLATSKRPVLMQYETWISHQFKDVLYLPIRFLFGWFKPEQKLSVLVMENWIEESDLKHIPIGVKVMILNPNVVVKQSTIRFQLKLSGYRYYMRYWFWTTLILVTAMTVSCQWFVATLAFVISAFMPIKKVKFVDTKEASSSSSDDDEVNEEEEDDEDVEEEEEEESSRMPLQTQTSFSSETAAFDTEPVTLSQTSLRAFQEDEEEELAMEPIPILEDRFSSPIELLFVRVSLLGSQFAPILQNHSFFLLMN